MPFNYARHHRKVPTLFHYSITTEQRGLPWWSWDKSEPRFNDARHRSVTVLSEHPAALSLPSAVHCLHPLARRACPPAPPADADHERSGGLDSSNTGLPHC